jgi:hypothetical protein
MKLKFEFEIFEAFEEALAIKPLLSFFAVWF